MMRFDGKVALVTGAGRGLGRSHALLLASLGASVAVNDLGESDSGPAADVVAEIEAAGGKAVASNGDVTQDAEAIVQTAIDAFGQLDIVVNSAGINVVRGMGDPDIIDQIRRQTEVNYIGSTAIIAAAWPHLLASGAGRIVNTASPTLVGFDTQTPYVGSKGAVFAFTRTLAIEADRVGIKVNAIAPTAYTRMLSEADLPESLKATLKTSMTTEMVSPLVGYFAHEDCAVTGETWLTQGGLMQRFVLSMNEGYTNPNATVDDIAENWEKIFDVSTAQPLDEVTKAGSIVDLLQD
jgi:NAD(P)-dependent dehydrogenase (short-subunit alcohol dehydrogenase family)